MIHIGYELALLFFIYSFFGWVFETVVAAVKKKQFVNRGLVNGPICTLYGTGAVIVTIFCQELVGVWLFIVSVVVATLLEWTAGHILEKLYQEKWWDYSNVKWNLDGYICAPVSVLWGVFCVIMMKWLNPLFHRLFSLIPVLPGKILVWVMMGVLVVDMLATLIIMSGRSRRIQQWEAVDSWLTGISSGIGRRIYGQVDARIRKAYTLKTSDVKKEKVTDVFACGCGFHKLVWLFMIGCFLGDVTETIFCRVRAGVWMSRSSVVWGPFSLVWGLAIAAVTLLLYRYKDRSDRFLFLMGTFLGGVYEYVCSVFTELVFGKVFWDYSKIPFNLGGRINLLYCFFWGLAAVVWFRFFLPRLERWIEKVPMLPGKCLTWIFVVFMCINILVSCMALTRSTQRSQGIPAESGWQEVMDQRFDDARLKQIYPNAIDVTPSKPNIP